MKEITIITFGFKYGQPNANYYFDVSFAKNPARESCWSLFDKPSDKMKDFVLSQKGVQDFIIHTTPLLRVLSELDDCMRIGIGCNAGRHRSVIIAEELAKQLETSELPVRLIHREWE